MTSQRGYVMFISLWKNKTLTKTQNKLGMDTICREILDSFFNFARSAPMVSGQILTWVNFSFFFKCLKETQSMLASFRLGEKSLKKRRK